MSVQTQIDRISEGVSNALTALTDKGVTVPDGANSDNLAELIAAVEVGFKSDDKLTRKNGSFRITASAGSTTSNTSYTVEHGLGAVPKYVLVYHVSESVSPNSSSGPTNPHMCGAYMSEISTGAVGAVGYSSSGNRVSSHSSSSSLISSIDEQSMVIKPGSNGGNFTVKGASSSGYSTSWSWYVWG